MAEVVRPQGAERSGDGQPVCAAGRAEATATDRSALPLWWRPAPFGHPAAIESLASIAAPLLAGFSITLIAVVGQAPQEFRWPGITMTILAAAASVLVWSVQCGFWTRQYAVSRADVYDWFGDFKNDPGLEADIQAEQIKGGRLYRGWERRTRRSYAAGILLLLAGVATCVAPPQPGKKTGVTVAQPFLRWVGVVVIAVAFLAELLWMASQSKWIAKHIKWLHNLLSIFVTPRFRRP
jgi:hypothetical protein